MGQKVCKWVQYKKKGSEQFHSGWKTIKLIKPAPFKHLNLEIYQLLLEKWFTSFYSKYNINFVSIKLNGFLIIRFPFHLEIWVATGAMIVTLLFLLLRVANECVGFLYILLVAAVPFGVGCLIQMCNECTSNKVPNGMVFRMIFSLLSLSHFCLYPGWRLISLTYLFM